MIPQVTHAMEKSSCARVAGCNPKGKGSIILHCLAPAFSIEF